MFIYFIAILLAVIFGLIYSRVNDASKNVFIFVYLVFLTIVFGLRYEVGTDWLSYLNHYNNVRNMEFFRNTEISYRAINLFSNYHDLGIAFVNIVCMFFFSIFMFFGLKRAGLNPFVFFSIVIPYHLVMSGVNFTRQGVALSIFIFAISYLIRGEKWKYLGSMIFAVTFHTSALLFFPLFFIRMKKRYLFLCLLFTTPFFYMFLMDRYEQYLIGSWESAGFFLRSLFLIVPGFFLMVNLPSIRKLNIIERRLILVSVFSFPFLVILSLFSTTLADRISYYFILLSVFMWMYYYEHYSSSNRRSLNYYGSLTMLVCSIVAFIVWIMYSTYIPHYEYRSYFSLWLNA